ncbi:barstar family protein [Streptomyces sp. NPDC047014]|uniref:barstar family protein n=1 Tax=Streptomyces sp. NPDC047014 TaxID=3155736 RepID=UPI00340FDDCF
MTLERRALAAVLAEVEGAGARWEVIRLDLEGVRGKAELIARCGVALRVPGWVGGNWDALADALRDLGWLPEVGRVLVVSSWGGFAVGWPREWGTFVEVLEEAVEFWRGELRVVLAEPGSLPGGPRLKRRRG